MIKPFNNRIAKLIKVGQFWASLYVCIAIKMHKVKIVKITWDPQSTYRDASSPPPAPTAQALPRCEPPSPAMETQQRMETQCPPPRFDSHCCSHNFCSLRVCVCYDERASWLPRLQSPSPNAKQNAGENKTFLHPVVKADLKGAGAIHHPCLPPESSVGWIMGSRPGA